MFRFLQRFKVKLPTAEEQPAPRILASYAFDWIVIVLIAAAGGAFNYSLPEERPFSLVDLSIAYPLVPSTIGIVSVGLISLAAPAILMAIICFFMVPGEDGRRSLKSPHALRRKLWEFFAGFTGLSLSIAIGFFATQGLKDAFGKPRPHLLAVCDPDLENIQSHIVGNYAGDLDIRWTLVNATICRTKDRGTLSDSFQSFPSGHCSFSFSGLLYFSLFLCAKFSWKIPYLPLQPIVPLWSNQQDVELLPLHRNRASSGRASSKDSPPPLAPSNPPNTSFGLTSHGAAPPTFGLVLVLVPIGVAAWIASTRYTDYWHDGFDVTGGSLIGIASAILSFRWYHLPISRGQGWAWGPRSKNRAFGISLGVESHAGPEGWQNGMTIQDG